MLTPPDVPRTPNGICHNCAAPAVPFGCFCAACYGGVLDPDGLPMRPGEFDGAWCEFNAEAAAYIADQQMPLHVAAAIEWEAYRRRLRRERGES